MRFVVAAYQWKIMGNQIQAVVGIQDILLSGCGKHLFIACIQKAKPESTR